MEEDLAVRRLEGRARTIARSVPILSAAARTPADVAEERIDAEVRRIQALGKEVEGIVLL